MINLNNKLTKLSPYILLLIISTGLISCDDNSFFELDAPPVTEWQNVDDLERAIAFPYKNTFLDQDAIGHWTHYTHLQMSDMVREIAINPGWQSPTIYGRETSTLGVSWVEGTYGPAYETIAATNKIINFLETDPFPNASPNDKTYNIDRIKGEALFIRAYNYYHLVQLFAPPYDPEGANDSRILPLRTTFPDEMDDALDVSAASTQEIYNQILADFEEAISLLPKEWNPEMPESYKFGRATKHAAAFYLAKTQLHMGEYTMAEQSLNSILDDPEIPRSLEPDPETVWLHNSSTDPLVSPEVIFWIFYSNPQRGSNRHPMQWYWFFNKTFSDPNDYRPWMIWSYGNNAMEKANIMVNGELTESWENDKRSKLYHFYQGADPTHPVQGADNDDFITAVPVAQFVGIDDPVVMVDKYFRVERFQNFPFVRTAEALILRAAIKAENGDGGGAAADLNRVRERAWDESESGPFVPLTTATFEDVDAEWLRELAFEADRVSFLQMFRKPIGPADRDVAPVMPPYENFNWQIPIEESDFQ